MNFYEPGSKGAYAHARPIGILPKIFWVIGVGSIGYAVADRYIVDQDEKLRWRRAVMARRSGMHHLADRPEWSAQSH